MSQASATIPVISAIASCYRVLLRREPDKAGLKGYMDAISNGSLTFEQALASFVESDEFQARMPEARTASDQIQFAEDQSQFGEFSMLLRHWINGTARHRIVIDVGARGRGGSNSYNLVRMFGWRGLLIEANPALIEGIRADFAGLDFELLNFAVSDYDGRATLHIGTNDDVSSLNAAAARGWGPTRGAVAVEVKRLGPLLQARAIPPDFDLLSLDIEGEDIKVLNDLIGTSTYRPSWIIIEASHDYQVKSLDDLKILSVVKSNYQIVGQTSANLILKREP